MAHTLFATNIHKLAYGYQPDHTPVDSTSAPCLKVWRSSHGGGGRAYHQAHRGQQRYGPGTTHGWVWKTVKKKKYLRIIF